MPKKKDKKETIGIIGLGVLGSVHKNWLEQNKDVRILTYDIEKECNSTIEKIAKESDYIFLYLPTDSKDGRLDTSIVDNVIADISKNNDCVPITIRSTLPIGHTQKLNDEYENYIYFIPEFLTQRFAKEDFEKNDRFIIGIPKIKKPNAMGIDILVITEDIISYFPKSDNIVRYASPKAEAVKLFTNSFYALKVIFANEIYSLCSGIGLDYEDIIEAMILDSRIGSNENDTSGKNVHFRVGQDGLKGFGGKCLPKDTLEVVNLMEEQKCGYGLLQKVVEINNKIRKTNEKDNSECDSISCPFCAD